MLGTEASVVNVIWHLELAFMSDPDGRHIEDRVSCFIKAKDVVPLIPATVGEVGVVGWHHHAAQKTLQKDAIHP